MHTAVENLLHWVKDQLKPLANTCKYRLQDTNDITFWLNSLNQKYAPFPPGMLLVSFDVVSMYPNITLDHGIRAARRKLLDRDSESPSIECITDAIKVIRMCSNIQFKGRNYIPIKGCNQGQKDACDFTDIAIDKVDQFLVDFSFNDLKLDIYGRYRDDTFLPWLHSIDNLLNFKQALDEHIKSINPNINFTMVYDYKKIQFFILLYM